MQGFASDKLCHNQIINNHIPKIGTKIQINHKNIDCIGRFGAAIRKKPLRYWRNGFVLSEPDGTNVEPFLSGFKAVV